MTSNETEIMRKGEKIEPQAGVYSFGLSFLLGPIAIIAKIILFGWISLPWKETALESGFFSGLLLVVLFFLLEALVIYLAVLIALYAVIKPFDAIYRHAQKKKMTSYELTVYGKIKKEKTATVSSKEPYLNLSNDDGVGGFLNIANEWSSKH